MSALLYQKPGFGNRISYISSADAVSAGYEKIGPSLYQAPDLAAPTVDTAPVISGSTTVGSTLTVTPGVYNGYPVPTITRQWQNNSVDIGGETGLTLDTTGLTASDSITCVETATNSEGSVNSTSNAIVLT